MENSTLPDVDRGPIIRAVNIILMSLSVVAVAIRFISRKLAKKGFSWDDWLCLAALPIVIVMNVFPIISTFHGLGRHRRYASWDAFEQIQFYFFLDLLFGPVAITLIKASVICFYRRTFRTTGRTFPIFTWTLLAILFSWLVAMFIVTLFSCNPIAAQWNPVVHGPCINNQKFFLGQTCSNVIIDFVLLFTPVPFLLKLHVSKPRKVGLLIVFALGYFVPVIAIMRMITANDVFTLAWAHELNPNGVDLDLTWNYVDAIMWTSSEPAAGIISCSIPASAYFFGKVFKRIGLSFSSTRSLPRPKHLYSSSFSRREKSQALPVSGSLVRLHEDHRSDQPEYPMNDIVTSVDSNNPGIARYEHEAPAGQIRVTEDVDLVFKPTGMV